MKQNLKFYGVISAILFATVTFGQVKKTTLPTYANPFQLKAQSSNKSPISPTQISSSEKIANENFRIDNGSITSILKGENLNVENFRENITKYLKLDSKHSFQVLSH